MTLEKEGFAVANDGFWSPPLTSEQLDAHGLLVIIIMFLGFICQLIAYFRMLECHFVSLF